MAKRGLAMGGGDSEKKPRLLEEAASAPGEACRQGSMETLQCASCACFSAMHRSFEFIQ